MTVNAYCFRQDEIELRFTWQIVKENMHVDIRVNTYCCILDCSYIRQNRGHCCVCGNVLLVALQNLFKHIAALLHALSGARIRTRRSIKLYVHCVSCSYTLVRFKCEYCLGNVGRIWGQRLYVMWEFDCLFVNIGRTGRMCVCVSCQDVLLVNVCRTGG